MYYVREYLLNNVTTSSLSSVFAFRRNLVQSIVRKVA